MATLTLVRHGQSTWNKQARFTGWSDVSLTKDGEAEAKKSAQALKNLHFDLAFCSQLSRAKDSLQIILKQLNLTLPVTYSHNLDERDYGDLTGKTHQEIIRDFGNDKYNLWHRSWDIAPPHGESLKDTHARVWHYYQDRILPELIKGKNVLLVASGNSLRALRKELDQISEEEIPFLEIPTGSVVSYEIKANGLPTNSHR